MNCGCVKNLGCFVPGQNIDFGFVAPCSGWYEFEVFSVNGFSVVSAMFDESDPIVLNFAFNENAETLIKVKVPPCAQVPGFNYFTSPDGACSFAVNGTIPNACS